jgi:FkbM family methyltransferase
MFPLKRVWKAVKLLRSLTFARAMFRHNVAAAVEHLEAIKLTKAATLIDIGANKGQFSLAFSKVFKNAQIIAFEPLPDAADRYQRLFERSQNVTLERFALSDIATKSTFYVTDRQDSSSLLKPGKGQHDAFGVAGSQAIEVVVHRLDDCLQLSELPKPILIKIDVQGAELQALKGCIDLEQANFVYVELSYVELYERQPLFNEVANYLSSRGFVLSGVFNQVTTQAFGPTQADFLFRSTRE